MSENRFNGRNSLNGYSNGFDGLQLVDGMLPLSSSRETSKYGMDNVDSFGDITSQDSDVLSRKHEDYDLDFDDAAAFAAKRWDDILAHASERIDVQDKSAAAKYTEWQVLTAEIQAKLTDPLSTPALKREMSKLHQLPRSLGFLAREFMNLVQPHPIKFELIWQLIYLNLKYSYTSPIRLRRTVDVLTRIRNVVARSNKILPFLDDDNEALIALVDFLDPCTVILVDLLAYLHHSSSDAEAELAWPKLKVGINSQFESLNDTVKHVSELHSYTKANQDRNIKNMSLRHALIPEEEEAAAFPILSLQQKPNTSFFGREDELKKIEKFLAPSRCGKDSLRTYTLYGRRGVGKTEIAVQFAYTNCCDFDAIFWIRCETSVSIRESFTQMAVRLQLPNADLEGRHEENLLAVQNWLRRTKKNWLLIFDNAERDQVLQKYWPVGADGAILITTRKYYNFAKDLKRQGDTIKPFDAKDSWDLLIQLLGDDWKKQEKEGNLPGSEETAAKNMLERLEGLPLAIQQAATAIKDPNIGGSTIVKTYEMFKEKINTLPERHSKSRSTSERALDALWDMAFNSLGRNARSLLGVLSWLSPDSILIDIFLPLNQDALSGPLEFCRQEASNLDSMNRASLKSTINPSSGFLKAANELLQKALIRWHGRFISIHRMVQEAVNFHDIDDLQESFNLASRLVYEQFPRQDREDSLYKRWAVCARYIHHGVFLSRKITDEFLHKDILQGTTYFVQLLSNCAWYLYEVGDYEGSKNIIDTAFAACDDKFSLQYAQLLDIAGSGFFDRCLLSECRVNWEAVLNIRKERLPHDHAKIAAIQNNLGNLETACGNFEKAKAYYERACMIWISGDDDTAYQLALTYLCIGRMHILQRSLQEAELMVSRAETLFIRLLGGDQGLMAHVHLCQGKIHFLHGREHWVLARKSYENCLKIAKTEFPIHPVTCTAYYAIACLEHSVGHLDASKNNLDKSKEIAELRSPTRDDGTIARILYKTSVVLESATLGNFADEAASLRDRAFLARDRLRGFGEGGFVAANTEEKDEEEASFDALVPLFFR